MALKPINSSVLYVGSLPYDWDENIIKSVVANSGNIVDVRLGFDYEGKNKGFCFVEYQTVRDAQRAAPLLNQILIFQQNGNPKRLKVEGSKEGFKSNKLPSESKRLLNITNMNIPTNVRLPPEMLSNSRNNSPLPPQQRHMTPPQQQRIMTPPQQQNFNPNLNTNIPTMSQEPPMPIKFTQASKNYPFVSTLPFTIPDKINETLSTVQPIQLIELIANMKNALRTDSTKAQEFFQANPNFALCAVQVLSLMGFVDDDVIKSSMESVSSSNTPQPSHQQPSMYQQPQQQQYQQYNNYNNNMYGNNSPYMRNQQTVSGSRWPHFPEETQQKLMRLNPEEANQMASMLSLPESSFRNLKEEAKHKIQSFRVQYGLPRYNDN
ncbi:hypothetical protein KGF54_000240 [Candida jiufengensis]|uniref:uncharacterized protein n=1 Tax=Candida jiufengensis TaxID=497108 RepID=UPI002224712E|nr:uncharacterized protein KGF54_000240 [Candida jiufengensis]KAI5957312.1 hypothetical protein KGF54_000240 [Candida jiufengensis]